MWIGPKLHPAVLFAFFVNEKSNFFYDCSMNLNPASFSWQLDYDKRWLRKFTGNRARRPAKQPLLCFSDHWKCLIVEFHFSISGPFWAIFSFLQTSPCVFQTRWDGFVQSEFWKSQKLHRLYWFALYYVYEWMGTAPNRTTPFISCGAYSQWRITDDVIEISEVRL